MGSNAVAPLVHLRQLMSDYVGGALHAFLVPSEDAHQSEYVAECDLRREFISEFNGSAGLALVTANAALLWTDGRYFLQATQQLSSDWKLMRVGEDVQVEEWIAMNLPSGSRVGIDGSCISIDTANRLTRALQPRDISLVLVTSNLVDATWPNRPQPPAGAIAIQDIRFSGKSVIDKLQALRERVKRSGSHGIVISALDEVAWLFNIRGCDVSYNPVVIAFAFVTLEEAFLYVDRSKVSSEVDDYLTTHNIKIRNYAAIASDVSLFATTKPSSSSLKDGQSEQCRVWLDPGNCSYSIYSEVQAGSREDKAIVLADSPLTLAKAIKNEAELAGMRSAHIRDGAACVSFWAWLDKQMQQQYGAAGYFELSKTDGPRKRKANEGEVRLTEVSVADKLQSLRSTCEHYMGLSFPTISSVGPNAAVIHYRPEEGRCREMDPDQIYLCDSGAQYRDGTTDVTRTVHFGTPSARERMCTTKVLQGHIALGTAVFPTGTTGHGLDPLARLPLWKCGLDYRHGTGHGVGSYLNVHEGPHLISFKKHAQDVPLQASMTVTNEPGYYEDDRFGIRIENVMVVRKAVVECAFDNLSPLQFLEFEPITWVPIQVKLMDLGLLNINEKKWVNEYHSTCRQLLLPLLSGYEKEWLLRATEPLPSGV